MTREELEEFASYAEEVGASYAVCRWPERFKALLDSYNPCPDKRIDPHKMTDAEYEAYLYEL
jgi:hypothetical protein